MATEGKVKLFGMWYSPYVHQIQLALKLKGIEYEYVEEDRDNKSPELLQYNPIHKKVPVLLHGDRPLPESFIILEYIDEVWSDVYPLFPKDPYETAVVRFWHHFYVDKINSSIIKMLTTAGEDQKAAIEEFRRILQHVEGEMRDGAFKGRRFFGGDQIGVLDLIYGCGSIWFLLLEEIAGVKVVDPEAFPCVRAWVHDFHGQELVKETLPAGERLLARAYSERARLLPQLAASGVQVQ